MVVEVGIAEVAVQSLSVVVARAGTQVEIQFAEAAWVDKMVGTLSAEIGGILFVVVGRKG